MYLYFRAYYCQHYLSIFTRGHLSTSDIKRKYLKPIHEMKTKNFNSWGLGGWGTTRKPKPTLKNIAVKMAVKVYILPVIALFIK